MSGASEWPGDAEWLQAPFPYMGGKSRVAAEVWKRLGTDVRNYVEPFFGSGAVLLARPGGAGHVETVNDADGMLANFWRSVQADPESVAHHADWIVSEADLHARHIWLVNRAESLADRLMGDPNWHDPKAAGWWVWGMCLWIGAGWCSSDGPWISADGRMVRREDAVSDGQRQEGVTAKLPRLGNGRGVHRKRVALGSMGRGVHRKRVHLGGGSGTGTGIHSLAARVDSGAGACDEHGQGLLRWFGALSDRLRRVRICCGDWTRVLGHTPTANLGTTAVFLDPPYGRGRTANLYTVDSYDVAHATREWALAHGDDPMFRIALCGYDDLVMPEPWTSYRWTTQGGYGNQGQGIGKANRTREVIWFSPHCLDPRPGWVQGNLEL